MMNTESQYTVVEDVDKLGCGSHVRYEHNGRAWTGMVLSVNEHSVGHRITVRIRCDQRRMAETVSWRQITTVEQP